MMHSQAGGLVVQVPIGESNIAAVERRVVAQVTTTKQAQVLWMSTHQQV
jgi:hypothetical protein